MLGRGDTKKIFLLKILNGPLYKTAPLTQFVRWSWREKLPLTEDAGRRLVPKKFL